jgi:phosphatidylinositol-3-phosphatase
MSSTHPCTADFLQHQANPTPTTLTVAVFVSSTTPGQTAMQKKIATLGLLCTALTSTVFAVEGPVPTGIAHLDHVFFIMMENHGYSQIINNPNAPYTNYLAQTANLATNYFAIAHPSLNNYLEVVGGSNFGVQSDNDPDWHNFYCLSNLASRTVNSDNPPSPNICPISGVGTDAAIPALDTVNETQGPPGTVNIDGTKSYPATSNTTGRMIGDQLVEAGLSWKSYQESLPTEGADLVNYSDGFFTNNTNFSAIVPALTTPLTQDGVVHLYASKHNPFVYFQSVQEGYDPNNSFENSVDFAGSGGLYADLGAGTVPNFSFIVPNQCNDQHGRGNSDQGCNFDPSDVGTQAGLNPALIIRGDVTIRKIVTAIKSSPAWSQGSNAIILVWDENDYSLAPNDNKVPLIVETNSGQNGVTSSKFYTHFALLKTLQAGFGLPCLNHACDSGETVMSDLFSGLATTTPGASALAASTAGLKAALVATKPGSDAE